MFTVLQKYLKIFSLFQEVSGTVQPRRNLAACATRDGRFDHPIRLGPSVRRVLSVFVCRREGLREVPTAADAGESGAAPQRPPVHHQTPQQPDDSQKHQDSASGVRSAFQPCMLLWGMNRQ